MNIEDLLDNLPIEGAAGVRSLCKIAKALGYSNPVQQVSVGEGLYLSDLTYMLEDNPDMVEAIFNVVREYHADTDDDTNEE